MIRPVTRQAQKFRPVAGFTLLVALFLLVVLSLLGLYMTRFSAVQHTTLAYGIQGARAMQAARAGIEWGVYEAINNNSCAPLSTFSTVGAGRLDDFGIRVECQSSSHFEGPVEVVTYQLVSSAETGTFGTLDYVFRRLRASISNQPP